jgi:PKD repeat protein
MKRILFFDFRIISLEKAGFFVIYPSILRKWAISVIAFMFFLSVNALSSPTVNIPPVTNNESARLCEGTTYTSNVLNGDHDPENTPLSVSTIPIAGPSHGTFSIDVTGNFSYAPFSGYSGTDKVIISICDAGIPVVECTNDTIFILVDDLIVANAGPDKETCEAESIQLAGNNPLPGSGNWSFISGPNTPLLTPAGSTSANVSGLIVSNTPYVFEYTINNGSCVSIDFISVINHEPPSTSFAGFDQYLCKSATDTIQMNANTPTSGEGQWTQVFGPGMATFLDPADPLTLITGLAEGTYLFDWTVSNCVCSPSSSAVLIQVTQPAIVFAGNDTTVMESQTSFIPNSAFAANYASILWSTSGTGSFTNPTNIHPVYNPSAPDIASGSILLTLTAVSNLPCPEVSDDMILNFSSQVAANAGPDAETCQGIPYPVSGSSASNFSSLLWSHNGSGGLIAANTLHPTYVPAINESGSVTLTLHVYSILPFNDSIVDQMILSINPLPTASISGGASICEGDTVLLRIDFTGSAPWNVSYFNGLNLTTISNIDTTPYWFNPNAPAGSNTYTLSSLTDLHCTATATQLQGSVIVIVNPAPVAGFSFQGSCGNLATSFFDGSISNGNNPIISYAWDFGDPASGAANSSSLQNPIHTYTIAGTYTVEEIVTTISGCSDTIKRQISVSSEFTADFTYQTSCIGSPAQFFSGLLTPAGDEIKSCNWDFGDPGSATNNTSILLNPAHTFDSAGFYIIKLNAKDLFGCTNTIVKSLEINAPPKASFTWTNSPFNSTVDFTSTTNSGNVAIAKYTWDFGDGTNQVLLPPANTVSHDYTNAGYYMVTLTVEDKNGCSASSSTQVLVSLMPQIDIEVKDTLICQNIPVTIVNRSNNSINQWIWNWGDGSTPTIDLVFQPTLSHTYTKSGNFVLSLTTIMNYSDMPVEDSIAQNIYVKPSPTAGFTANSHCLGEMVYFSDSENTNGSELLRYSWNFGDPVSTTDTSTSRHPGYTYHSAGSFITILSVENTFGCSDTISHMLRVYALPEAKFSNSSSCPGAPTYFTAYSETMNAPLTQWNWKIGNEMTDGESTSFTFENPGTYPVFLSVSDANGCTDTISSLLVINPSPISAFSIEENFKNEQGKVRLNNGSLNGTSYYWDFGNGETSIEKSPVATFTENGRYHIGLFTSNANGCSDSISFEYTLLFKSLYVPSAFAPGDQLETINRWKPVGENLLSYKVEVYDRWNHLLWFSDKLDGQGSPLESWDGTYKGNPCAGGVYLWKVTASYVDGTQWQNRDAGNHENLWKQNSGTLTLIR